MTRLPPGMRKKGRKFYGRYKRRERSFGSHRATAQRLFEAWKREVDLSEFGLGSRAKQNAKLQDLLDEYVREKRGQVTAHHLETIDQQIDDVIRMLRVPRVSDVTVDRVERVRKVLIRKGNANRTVNMKIQALGSMLRWAVRTERIESNPIQVVRALPESGQEQRVRHGLTVQEGQQLLRAALADDEARRERPGSRPSIPQAMMIELLCETGCRLTEACRLKWGDLKKSEHDRASFRREEG